MSPIDPNDEVGELQRRVAGDPDDIDAREALAALLIESGDVRAGVAQLYTAAERLGNRGAFLRAVAVLQRLIQAEPGHEHAQRLLARLYQRVPREPLLAAEAPPSIVDDDTLGGRLFKLPESSAQALSQILPFAEEDPPALAGALVVPVPAGPAEPARPLLAALDRELRATGSVASALGLSSGKMRRLELGATDPAASAGALDLGERISPAAAALDVDRLPPSPILDLLERGPLGRLLGMVDLLRWPAGAVTFDAHTQSRALHVVVQGHLEVRREVEGRGMVAVDHLTMGDFYGEFELLTLTGTHAQIAALEPSDVLELPEHVLAAIADHHPAALDLLWDAYFRRSFHSVVATAPLFAGLPVEVIRAMASEVEPLVFEVGDLVLREGELPTGLYGLVGGGLAVVRPSRAAEIVTRLVPGDFFGLLSSAAGEATKASVVATERSTLLWLPLPSLEALRAAHPELAQALAEASRSRAWRFKLELH